MAIEHRQTLFGGKYDNTPLLLQNIILDHIRDDMEESVNKKTKLYISQNGENGRRSEEKRKLYSSWRNEQLILEIVKVAKKYNGLFTVGDICREMGKTDKASISKLIELGIKNGGFEKVADCGVSFLIIEGERVRQLLSSPPKAGRQIVTPEEYQKVRSRTPSGPTGAIYRLVNYFKEESPASSI